MKISPLLLALGAALCAASPRADISLFEWRINQDGAISRSDLGDPLPLGSVFDTSTGLGSVHLSFSSPGAHFGLFFVDHELSEGVNTFFNELGGAFGTPGPGLSWEIDEPGFVFGDIVDNFTANSLDNSVGTADPEDVSMALGFNFFLSSGELGVLSFLLTETAPAGFYLRHFDPDSGEQLYFAASLSITGGEPPRVPDGGSTLALFMVAAGALLGLRSGRGNGSERSVQ